MVFLISASGVNCFTSCCRVSHTQEPLTMDGSPSTLCIVDKTALFGTSLIYDICSFSSKAFLVSFCNRPRHCCRCDRSSFTSSFCRTSVMLCNQCHADKSDIRILHKMFVSGWNCVFLYRCKPVFCRCYLLLSLSCSYRVAEWMSKDAPSLHPWKWVTNPPSPQWAL